MQVEVIRHAATTVTPWKNGKGIGRNIAAWPRQAEGEFDWLIATAEMTGTVPFSSYPGIDRSLLVIAGRLLVKSTSRETVLSKDSETLEFPGEEEIVGTALDEVTMHDFNLLSKRGVVRHTLERWEAPPQGRDVIGFDTLVIHVQEGNAEVSQGEFEAKIHVGDTVILRELRGQAVHIKSIDTAICIVGDIRYL